jgi:ABC-type branched-subunit amino acid transport system substrate-binding protein
VAKSVAVACAKYGIEYPGSIYIDEGTVDATIQVAKLKRQNPDFIIITTYESESSAFVRARAQMGWYVTTFWDAGIIPKTEKLSGIPIGDKCDEMGYFLQDLRRPKVKALYDTAVKRWGEFGKGVHTFWECYDTMKMVGWAIKKAGSDDPKAIRDALETIKDWQAISGPPGTTFSFSSANHRAMDRHMAVWMKYKNGEWFPTD